MALSEGLARNGWYVSPDGLAQCVEACKEKGLDPTLKNIEKTALDCDLRVIGAQGLSDDIIRNLQHQVNGPIVLQIQKLKNVAVPSTQQQNASPSRRLLRLQLTDGHIHCSGVEIEGAIDKLSPMTPPGTKLKLLGTVEVQNGFLLLKKSSIQVLGGRVEHLYKKWSLHMALPDNVDRGKGGMDGPPPFTPFKNVVGMEQNKTGSHSSSRKETDSSFRKEMGSSSRKETDSGFREKTGSGSREETGPHSRNRSLPDARERNTSEVKPGDGAKTQWKNGDSIQGRDVSQRQGSSKPGPQQKENRTYESRQPSRNSQHREGHRGRRSRGEEDSDGSMVSGKPKSTYQLSDWLDQKLKINSKPSTLPEPVEEDDLELRLAIEESIRVQREESRDGVGQSENSAASRDDHFGRDDHFDSRDDRRDDRFGGRNDDRFGGRNDDRFGGRNDRRDDHFGRDDRFGGRNDRRDDHFGRDDRFGGRNDRRDDRCGGRNDDRFGGRNDDRFGGRNDDRFGGRNDDRFGGRNDDRFGGRNDRFGGRNDDRFGGRNDDRFGGRNDDRFGGRNDDRFGGRNDDRFGGRNDDRFGGRNDDRFGGRNDDRFGGRNDRRDDRFGSSGDHFGRRPNPGHHRGGRNEDYAIHYSGNQRSDGHKQGGVVMKGGRDGGHERSEGHNQGGVAMKGGRDGGHEHNWQGQEQKSRWQGHEKSRWSNNDPYQQAERKGQVGNHGDRYTKRGECEDGLQADQGRVGPHQQSKGRSGDRLTWQQDEKRRDLPRTEKPAGGGAGLKKFDQQQPSMEEGYNWDWVNKSVPSSASRNNSHK